MTEYISREAEINGQKRFCGYLDDDMLLRLETAISRLPADDSVPVVRCRDCKYRWRAEGGKLMYDELVKQLRAHNGWALNKTLDEAADAIEKLRKLADAITHVCECCVGCELGKNG